MLVVGDAEAEAGTVALRHRDHGDLGTVSVEDVIARITQEINTRADQPA